MVKRNTARLERAMLEAVKVARKKPREKRTKKERVLVQAANLLKDIERLEAKYGELDLG